MLLKSSFKIVFQFIVFFIFSNSVKAQENSIKSKFENGFAIGFKEGYCYNQFKANCLVPLTPLPPLPSINERPDSYQDGFNRGFQVGLDLRRLEGGQSTSYQSLPNYRFNEYVETLPINAYANVGLYLQTKLNGRKKWVQERINGIHDLNYSLLFDLDNDAYNRLRNSISNTKNKLKGVSGDWADDRIFQQTLRIIDFAGLENEIYSAYRNTLALSKKNKISEKQFVDLLSIAYDSLDTNPMLSLKLASEAESMHVDSFFYYKINDIKSRVYENLENFELALSYNEVFTSDKNIRPKELQHAIYRKAILLINLNKFSDALVQFNNPLLLNISDTLSLYITQSKGVIYYNLGAFDKAILNIDKVLGAELIGCLSKESIIWCKQIKAASLRELGKYQEALIIINLAIKENNSTSNPSLYATKGKIIFLMKDYKNALNEFIKTTLLDDKDAESFYYLGLCYKKLNQKTKACENLQKAIKLGSNEALQEYPNTCK